ncbi:putative 2OG-Fe(II) oxygenase [Sphingomonas limnosediminicola]|uniref:2OG-Fe(II) oxygenase n=1 Tax=Sphingomonas limnosediminicola TaxID=940133 RepID=A0ABP7LL16_9SPHN
MTVVTARTVDPAEVLDRAIKSLKMLDTPLPLEDVDRALKLVPSDARLWHVKGLIHREQERRDLAIPALKRATELAPSEPLIAHGYARTLLEAGLPSVDAFGRALKLAPNNPDVTRGLVASLSAIGRSAEALAGLETVLRRSPLWTEGHVLLANLRWAEGEREGFTRSFEEALAQHPNSLELRREQLAALLEAEHFEEVFSRVAEGRRMFGDHILFSSHEVAALSESGNIAEADPLFSQLAELNFSNIDMWRVRHLIRAGRPDEASSVIDRWLGSSDEDLFWAYAATAWRMTGDSRSDWLEGDQRFVGVYDITDKLPAMDRLADTLRRLHVSKSQFFGQSVRGGTQTDGHLFQRIEPEIVALRDAVRSVVAEHAAQLPAVDPRHPLLRWRPKQVDFNGAWSVRLVGGGNHANHVHPMGWLSSAFYVVLPDDFGKDKAGWLTLGEPQAQLGVGVQPHRFIEPKPGTLALFPSWMWHGTRKFDEGERITVAFDVAAGRAPGS